MLNIASRWTDKLVRMPWATMLPLWLPMPFLLSGGVRSVTGWSLGASLVPCALLVVGAAVLSWFYSAPDLTVASGRIAALATFGSAAILVVWTFRLWWSPLYGGLPNTVWGVDVGNHAIIYQRFTGAEHAVYEGLVGLYSLMHWYRRTLGAGLSDTASIYYGLRFAHYTCLLTVPLAIALVAYPCVAKLRTTREQLLALVLALPFQLAVIAYLIFPVAGYYQAEGFYSQIAGIYPLMLGWLSFGLFENAALRFLICMFWIIAQRFTYGLNLGDLLITLAYAWLWEAPAIRVRWLRWGAWLFVPVGLAASYVVYTKLYPLRFAHGYFMNQSVPWVLGAQTLLSVALLAAPAALRAAEIGVSEPSLRMWRYAGTFGLVNSAVTAAYFGYDQPTEYYILKYSFYAILLVSAAAIGPIASVVAHAVSSEWRWWFRPASLRLLIGMLCVAAFASGAMMRGHLIYRPLARERFERTKPNAVLFSHFEPRVDTYINQTLAQQKAEFGGYYDSYWPRMFLMNALRMQFSAVPDYHYNRAFERAERMFEDKKNACYFYLGDENSYHGGPNAPMKLHIAQLREHKLECTPFRPRWGLSELSVCAACF